MCHDSSLAFRTLHPLCRFRLGRQEDAHEYLIALLDAMHESSLRGLSPKPSAELALTSFIYRIFGGRIRSQVCAVCHPPPDPPLCAAERPACAAIHGSLPRTHLQVSFKYDSGAWSYGIIGCQSCTRAMSCACSLRPVRSSMQVKCTDCGFESNTYDPILDISLEINRAASVEKALQRYTAGEALDGANKYRCPKQKRFVRAVKRITIEARVSTYARPLRHFALHLRGFWRRPAVCLRRLRTCPSAVALWCHTDTTAAGPTFLQCSLACNRALKACLMRWCRTHRRCWFCS